MATVKPVVKILRTFLASLQKLQSTRRDTIWVWEYIYIYIYEVNGNVLYIKHARKQNIYDPLLGQKSRYSELFWSAFSRTGTEYGEIKGISPF